MDEHLGPEATSLKAISRSSACRMAHGVGNGGGSAQAMNRLLSSIGDCPFIASVSLIPLIARMRSHYLHTGVGNMLLDRPSMQFGLVCTLLSPCPCLTRGFLRRILCHKNGAYRPGLARILLAQASDTLQSAQRPFLRFVVYYIMRFRGKETHVMVVPGFTMVLNSPDLNAERFRRASCP